MTAGQRFPTRQGLRSTAATRQVDAIQLSRESDPDRSLHRVDHGEAGLHRRHSCAALDVGGPAHLHLRAEVRHGLAARHARRRPSHAKERTLLPVPGRPDIRVAAHAVVAVVAALVGFLAGRTCEPTGGSPGGLRSEASTDPGDFPAPSTGPAAAAPSASSQSAGSSASRSPEPDASGGGGHEGSAALARARHGDLAALKTIEARPQGQRTVEEAVALEAGHAALAVRDAEVMVSDLAARPALFGDVTTMAHARRMALDPAVAPALLSGLARLPHATVPDLLFDLAWRGEPGARLVLLADDLLEGPARKQASPVLGVTLLVRAARSCERFTALLSRVTEEADDRVLPVLARLDVRTGCGKKREEDCFACLRGGEPAAALQAARDAARGRPFAAPWAAKKR